MAQIDAARGQATAKDEASDDANLVAANFDALVQLLAELNIASLWDAATFQECRVLVEELVECVSIFPDHLEVKIAGAPRLNAFLGEVGLKESANVGVGGGKDPTTTWAVLDGELNLGA